MIQPQTDVHGVQVVGNPPPVSMKPVSLLPFWLEPAALLLVLGFLTCMLARVLQRRPAAWPVPLLLGLEVGRPERAPEAESLPEPVPIPLPDEISPIAADAEADREAREEEAELVA